MHGADPHQAGLGEEGQNQHLWGLGRVEPRFVGGGAGGGWLVGQEAQARAEDRKGGDVTTPCSGLQLEFESSTISLL